MGWMRTARGYDLGEVASALQKSVRRGDGRMACYWALELAESGMHAYAWRRLLVVSAEDVAAVVTQEIRALRDCHEEAVHKARKKAGRPPGRVFLAKACLLLAGAAKSRDADHAGLLLYDPKLPSDEEIEEELSRARRSSEPVPEYALDCHTSKGRRLGKTKAQFIQDEHEALEPRQRGIFDDLVPRRRRTAGG